MKNIGIGVALTFLATCWSQFLWAYQQCRSALIVSFGVRTDLVSVVTYYCMRHAKPSRFGSRVYDSCAMFVRPNRRTEQVATEDISLQARLFWIDWRPFWVSGANRTSVDSTMTVTFPRFLFDQDSFILRALDVYNAAQTTGTGRYRVRHITGMVGKPVNVASQGMIGAPKGSSQCGFLDKRILRWTREDLQPETTNNGCAIDHLALCPDAERLIEECRRWIENQNWFVLRGIPWRRSFCLYGAPGTGKTALVRAIAEDFGLPIYSYDLATLFNDELRREWTDMLAESPCIALIEDIDAVFNGRETVHGELSFDCLLNCLDGIERASGLLTFITTNRIETLDTALATCGPNDIASRPGRIDRMVEMLPLTESGRIKLAKRILSDWPESWAHVVQDGDGDSGAQFQERCTAVAIERYWS